MGGMPSLESSIDSLYQGPLEEFVAARTALAKPLQLAGFEALAGVTVKAPAHAREERQTVPSTTTAARRPSPVRLANEEQARRRKAAAAERQHRAAVKKAEATIARAQAGEARA